MRKIIINRVRRKEEKEKTSKKKEEKKTGKGSLQKKMKVRKYGLKRKADK